MTTPPEYVTVYDVARVWGVSLRTVYRWIAHGLPVHRPPHSRICRLRWTEVERWMAGAQEAVPQEDEGLFRQPRRRLSLGVTGRQ